MGGAYATDTIISLVRLAVRARPESDALSLLPARYHIFARALEGAFLCLNQSHPAHADEGHPRLFLNRHEECPHCHARALELATCPRCGTAYLVGREVSERTANGERRRVLRHPTATTEDLTKGLSYFVLTAQLQQPDEDEAIVSGEEVDGLDTERLEPFTICLGCGAIEGAGCTCRSTTPPIVLQRVLSDQDPLRRCVACGARSPNGVVYRFLTGQDAPVSVLGTSLYQLLPPTDDETAVLPGEGRKLLVFADSRQAAAFFAPYLERTYQQILRRRVILKALAGDEADHNARAGHLRLQDLTGRVLAVAEHAGLFRADQSYDERTTLVNQWLMQEFIALDSRIGLEGLGLLHFRLVPPQNWAPPQALLESPWNFTREEVSALFVAMLTTLRQQGVVTFPPNVDPRDAAFEPRNVELFVRDYADATQHVLGWLPKRGGNRRVDYLVRVLRRRRPEMAPREAEQTAQEVVKGLWTYFTNQQSPWRGHLAPEQRARQGVVYRLDHRFWEWAPVAETGTPVYRCNRCFNVTYTNLEGVCPTYGCDGDLERVDGAAGAWVSNHYRHLYQTLAPIQLSAEEHTAQWMPKVASEIQSRFIDGRINVLSCSTTFELGVDVGSLQAVLMRNVPPTTANYVQRAGRAGRRTDSAALVLTYAQRRSHDLTHFKEPERMVSGHVRPPVVVVRNEKIVRRHVHSVLLAAFFRWARARREREFRTVGTFFAPEDALSGPHLLEEYLREPLEPLQEALRRIVPPELHHELGLDDWGWLPQLTNGEGTGILDLAVREVTGDLDLYAQLEREAASARRYKQADHFHRVAQTVRNRDLLGFLGSRNVLPKYGFPTDVVPLRTNHIPLREADEVDLQRDLRVAISEYAPGSEIVAAKRIWVGGGLYILSGRDWQTWYYAVCPNCGRFHRSLKPLDPHCQVCNANLFGWPRHYGQYVRPEFGFVAGRDTRDTGERPPHRLYASRVAFSNYADEGQEGPNEPQFISALSGPTVQVMTRYSRFGKLALVNPGMDNNGFTICTSCGWAEPVTPTATGRRTRRKAQHDNPRTGQPCKGRTENWHLGHEFITDVLELRFTGALPPANEYAVWLSTLYAILEGTSETLSIPRDDLDGTLYRYSTDYPPALVLYDNVPGGAGHVRRLSEGKVLPVILRAAWDRVARCECGEETSCYECLRNFYNQFYHDQLKRGLARDFLSRVLQ